MDIRDIRSPLRLWAYVAFNNGTVNLMPVFELDSVDVGEWTSRDIHQTALQYIDLRGRTQFRLRFDLDDDDHRDDAVYFYSGNEKRLNNRPWLLVIYRLP